MLSSARKVDILVFLDQPSVTILPILCAKVLRKKLIITFWGRSSQGVAFTSRETLPRLKGTILSAIYKVFEEIACFLASQISVESPNVVNALGLTKYKKKIAINCAPYIDSQIYSVKKDMKERRNVVGYIGRLAWVKGVMNFVQAMPLILKERNDIEFLLGGEGVLSNRIKNELERHNLLPEVKYMGWIPRSDFPHYLNELKLLVLPSHAAEGLPNIIKEAMACGTIVLATPVGGVPDIIKDGETGFILENNSPECIAQKIIMALNHPNLEKVAIKARALVGREFTYEAAVERYKNTLDSLA